MFRIRCLPGFLLISLIFHLLCSTTEAALVNITSAESTFERTNLLWYQTTLPSLDASYLRTADTTGYLTITQDTKFFDLMGESVWGYVYDYHKSNWSFIGIMNPRQSEWTIDLKLNRFFDELYGGLKIAFVYGGFQFAEPLTASYTLNNVSQVPVPPAIFLLGSGMITLLGLRRAIKLR
ncbi:MAG: hypothetical protein HY895_03075 [Deltaproteobacteria bacterium]|nr:hypothetical protein [Deltaproteobacteria bacterium]